MKTLFIFISLSVSFSLKASLLEKDFFLKVKTLNVTYELSTKGKYFEWILNGAKFSFYQKPCHQKQLKQINKLLVSNLVKFKMAKTDTPKKNDYTLQINKFKYSLDSKNSYTAEIITLPEHIMESVKLANLACKK